MITGRINQIEPIALPPPPRDGRKGLARDPVAARLAHSDARRDIRRPGSSSPEPCARRCVTPRVHTDETHASLPTPPPRPAAGSGLFVRNAARNNNDNVYNIMITTTRRAYSLGNLPVARRQPPPGARQLSGHARHRSRRLRNAGRSSRRGKSSAGERQARSRPRSTAQSLARLSQFDAVPSPLAAERRRRVECRPGAQSRLWSARSACSLCTDPCLTRRLASARNFEFVQLHLP